MLFLTDVDHVSFEKANETRQNNLQSATVSLQVVMMDSYKGTLESIKPSRVKRKEFRPFYFSCNNKISRNISIYSSFKMFKITI